MRLIKNYCSILFFLVFYSFNPWAIGSTIVSTNQGFEETGSCVGVWDAVSKDCPNGYSGYQPNNTSTLIGVDDYLDNNNNVLSIKFNNGLTGTTRATVTQNITSITPGESYRVSVLAKSNGLVGDLILIATEKDSSGAVVASHEVVGARGYSSWNKLLIEQVVQAGTARISIGVKASVTSSECTDDCGEAMFDEFIVEKTIVSRRTNCHRS